ncbi:MAG: alpha/beta hydrolase [Clostridiaceae bacterium]|jgi:pimeloyl-ACP methyl ester carboxylesterase|nr:alpha/beta hydrolase [Clostridiaceae bacterium]
MHSVHDKYLKINEISIRYRESGNGFPLLLVHGIAGFLEEWEMSIEELSKHYRVIALDLPGHGLSHKPQIAYTLDRLTGFLKDFVTEMKLEQFYLVGHSLGGAVCLNFVIKYPSLVKKLIVVNSAFTKFPTACRFSSFKFLQKINIKVPLWALRAVTRKSFFNKNSMTPDWLNSAYTYINKPGALRTMFSIIHECMSISGLKKDLVVAFQDGLSKIKIPVLIVYGNKDAIVPNENSFMLHKLICNSQIHLVQDCGHELQYEKSHEFCKISIQFLQ